MNIIEAMYLIPVGFRLHVGREAREENPTESFTFASLYADPPEDGWHVGKDVYHEADRHRPKVLASVSAGSDLEAFELLTVRLIVSRFGTPAQLEQIDKAMDARVARREKIGNTTSAGVAPTIDGLRTLIVTIAKSIREVHGERSAVAIAVGIPIQGGHDRFAAYVMGPCLMERGLIDWASESWREQMRAHVNAPTVVATGPTTFSVTIPKAGDS